MSAQGFDGLNRYDDSVGDPPAPFDPLRLCVYATVALIACVLGPIALLGFSILAITGYAKARRAGLLRSRCKIGDTRRSPGKQGSRTPRTFGYGPFG